MKKTPVDLQKTFPDVPCVSQMSGGLSVRLSIPQNGLAFRQDLEKVGKTLFDWERGNVHCALNQHLENLSNHSDN